MPIENFVILEAERTVTTEQGEKVKQVLEFKDLPYIDNSDSEKIAESDNFMEALQLFLVENCSDSDSRQIFNLILDWTDHYKKQGFEVGFTFANGGYKSIP